MKGKISNFLIGRLVSELGLVEHLKTCKVQLACTLAWTSLQSILSFLIFIKTVIIYKIMQYVIERMIIPVNILICRRTFHEVLVLEKGKVYYLFALVPFLSGGSGY